jgi:acetaldehyde dehydrogenase (acetylating)
MANYDYDLQSIQETRDLARAGEAASKTLATYTEEQIDRILRSMVRAAEENSARLAKMAVEETGFGKVEDKIFKNHMAATMVYENMKDMKTIGVIHEDTVNRVIEIAEPVGLVMGIVPSTNPTSTAIYKSLICMKARNGIVFSPHPSAVKCTCEAARVMAEAAVAAGAPEGAISCITKPSIAATDELMKCRETKMILATGGPAMVHAAYSAGKPALGVGAGNSPAYIERTANVRQSVKDIMASKTFDYGTICASEQSVIVEECNRDQVMNEFRAQGGYFMTTEETKKVCDLLFKNGHSMNAKFVGRPPQVIAAAAGITIPEGTRVLIGEQGGVGDGYPLSYEKLTTVLAFYTVRDWQEACELSIKLLQNGIGHTMNIHTEDREMVMRFSAKPASRILVNTGGTQGGTGASTGLAPALTLGCGAVGGSATSDNVTPLNLINIKRVAYGIVDLDTLAAKAGASASASCAMASAGPCAPITQPAAPCRGGCSGSPSEGYAPVNLNKSPLEYSVGCSSCKGGTAAAPLDVSGDARTVTGEDLRAFVDQLVEAMKAGS